MSRKSLAITLVLVLAAGFGAFAVEEERPLYGEWENTLTLDPMGDPIVDGFDSVLDVTYVSGEITYTSVSEFDLSGYADQTFGVSTSMGLLTLDSTANFDPSAPGLDYWKNSASLTLGGVNIGTLFLLQNAGTSQDPSFGAGMMLSLSGETPGGVSVAVDNYFGMDANADMDSGYEIITAHG